MNIHPPITIKEFKKNNPGKNYSDYCNYLTEYYEGQIIFPSEDNRTLHDLTAMASALQNILSTCINEISDKAYND